VTEDAKEGHMEGEEEEHVGDGGNGAHAGAKDTTALAELLHEHERANQASYTIPVRGDAEQGPVDDGCCHCDNLDLRPLPPNPQPEHVKRRFQGHINAEDEQCHQLDECSRPAELTVLGPSDGLEKRKPKVDECHNSDEELVVAAVVHVVQAERAIVQLAVRRPTVQRILDQRGGYIEAQSIYFPIPGPVMRLPLPAAEQAPE